jgi:hypothetical protein
MGFATLPSQPLVSQKCQLKHVLLVLVVTFSISLLFPPIYILKKTEKRKVPLSSFHVRDSCQGGRLQWPARRAGRPVAVGLAGCRTVHGLDAITMKYTGER